MSRKTQHKLGVTLDNHGATFAVWAPNAKSVSVAVPYISYDTSNKTSMEIDENGVWSAYVKNAEPGQPYKFLIETDDEILIKNDPRARALTLSEGGDSIIADPDYSWHDHDFTPPAAEKQIIYELHIGTFHRRDSSSQGTFYDAIEKLDYLKDLGFNMIELMPVTSMSSGNGWGYNTTHVFSVETAYGGRRGLMDFVSACHERGIGVILDVVYNHFPGDTELWQFDGWSRPDVKNDGGIYFYGGEYADTPWGARPDYGRPEVRSFILDSIVMWLNEYHIDGLRLDSTGYLRSTTGNDDPEHAIADAWLLLQGATKLAHKVDANSFMIAEDTGSNAALTQPIDHGGAGFNAQWWLNFAHAVRHQLGMDVPFEADFIHELTGGFNGNAFEKIIFSDSHDTAANGHVRINEAATPGNASSLVARYRTIVASAVTLTAPGIPMILQGQEFTQEGAFNDWQELDWEKADKYNGVVLAHQHLIALRRNQYGHTAGLMGHNTEILHANADNHIYVYRRWQNGGVNDDCLVIVNFSKNRFDNYIFHAENFKNSTWRVRFNSSWHGYSPDFHQNPLEVVEVSADGIADIRLSEYNVLILSQD